MDDATISSSYILQSRPIGGWSTQKIFNPVHRSRSSKQIGGPRNLRYGLIMIFIAIILRFVIFYLRVSPISKKVDLEASIEKILFLF